MEFIMVKTKPQIPVYDFVLNSNSVSFSICAKHFQTLNQSQYNFSF